MARNEAELRKPEIRKAILDAGVEAFLMNGFAATSVGDISTRAGIPKGSFYYYFDSKAEMAIHAVGHYAALDDSFRSSLLSETGSPMKSLENYFTKQIGYFEAKGYTGGCLFGDLGLELADSDPSVAEEIRSQLDRWTAVIARVLRTAKHAGELRSVLPASVLARFLINAWEGALLRMRLEKSSVPLHEFKKIIFENLLDV